MKKAVLALIFGVSIINICNGNVEGWDVGDEYNGIKIERRRNDFIEKYIVKWDEIEQLLITLVEEH